MTQEAVQITTTPPLPGLQLVQDLNKALQTLATDFSGATDPAAMAWPYSTWADTGTGTLKRRNAANSAWVIEGRLLRAHLPVYAAGEVPTTDQGAIYVIGKGPMEWSSGASTYRRTDDAPADGLTYARKDSAWIALSDASPARPTLVKPLDTGPCLIKKTADTISVAAGTYIRVGSAYRSFDVETAVTMPGTLTPGSDYSVWCSPDGGLTAVRDQYGSPASPPAAGAVKFGGFHYGLVAAGETVAGGSFSTSGVTSSGGSMAWQQSDVDRIAGINEFSIWDLGWRCAGEQNGMAYSPLSKSWIAIYFCGITPHLDGISAYDTAVASGTVLPAVPLEWGGDGTLKYAALNSWAAQELVSAHGLRLVRSIEEFIPAAFGVTEGQSLGGGSVTIPATARQPGYTSRIGIEQATGHAWVIGAPYNAAGGSAYSGNGRGSWYGSYGLPLFGGYRANAANSGSRAAHFDTALSTSSWSYSVRAAGDHLNLGRTAR